MSPPLLHKYPSPTLHSSLFSSFPPSGLLCKKLRKNRFTTHFIMFFSQEATQLEKPGFEIGFTPSEIQELLSLCESPTGGSPNSGSESNSNSNSNRVVYSVDERKRRRMISNRESARRSRWRKKRHLENLTVQLNRLELQNRELKNLFGSVLEHCRVVWRENDRLTTEYLSLQTRLSDLCHVLVSIQSQR